ncbi:MAG: gliding motility-associated C-terminal domain-containing protein [Saprospiraceae bacterium]
MPCVADAQVVPTPPAVDNSCGDPVDVSGPVVGPDPVCSGTKTYTWTYTDCTGNSLTWVYTYTVMPALFTLPANGSSTVSCIIDAQTVPTPPTVTNSCGDPVTPTEPVVGADPACSGTKVYTWTYTDCNGNSLPWTFTYTISPPTFTLPANDGTTVPCIADAQTVPTPPSVNNSCGAPLAVTGPVVGADPVCSGTKTYTWTYTDCTGSTAQWLYTYTITPPSFSLPADGGSTVACISDAQVVPTPPAVDNACGDPLTISGPVVGADPVCSGVKTYTWTYTDCTGNTVDWVYTYTIPPSNVVLPPDGGSTVACISDAQVVPTPPSITDACGQAVIPTGPAEGPDPVCSGTKNYVWTYLDCNGNSLPWTYTYTISPPTFNLPANGGSTVPCIADAQTVPVPPAVVNSCGDPVAVTGPVIGPDPISCSGPKTYTWTYTDCTGSSVDWVYTYTIMPTTFMLPANEGSSVSCVIDAQVVPTPPVVNNSCNDPLVTTGPVVSADPVCGGTKTYTWTYTDCAGNTDDWVYTYTVTSNVVPVFDAPPADVTVTCAEDAPVMISLNYTDDCSPDGSVAGVDSPLSGNCPGTITRLWTFTDECGNVGSVTQTIIVNDQIPPTASDPTPLALSGCNTAIPAPDVTVVTDEADNCTSSIIVAFVGDATSLVGCTETTTRSFSVIDACGNSIVVTQLITRTVDTTPPVISTPPADITVTCLFEVPEIVDLTYTDNCSTGGTISGVVTGPSGNPLTVIHTWTVTDDCGNAASVSQTITVNEVLIPLSVTEEFCEGGFVIVYGTTYSVPGTYQDTILSTTGGCDTLVTIVVNELQTSAGTETYQGCEGDGYTVDVNGTTYSEILPNGVETLTGSNGCDSVVTITLTFAAPGFGTETYSGCTDDGYSVVVNGTTYNEGNQDGVENFTGPNGCDTTVTIDLNFSPGLTGTETYSGCEGDGYFVIVNGTTYDENNPTGTEFFDLPGCDSTVTIDLFFAPVEVVDIEDVPELCTTAPPITLVGTPPGGVWSGAVNSTLLDPASLGTGIHQVIYTVNPGACESADTIDVSIYEITIVCETLKDETMPGDDDGEGQVTISGGNAPYDVSWSGPESGSIIINADGTFTINNLSAGSYTVTAVDATGCTTSCQFVINVGGPCEIIIDDVVIQDATCSGIDDGAISINVSGGVIPYEYSIDGLNFQTSNVFTDLAPGTYTIYVTDATGCIVSENVTIGVGPGPELAIVEIVDATCGVLNGSIEVDATGGSTPYTYSIDGTNYGASGFFPGLGAGSYSVYLIDAAGCTDTLPVTVAASNAPVINDIDVTNSSCGNANGSITIIASGGVAPLEYSINGVDFQSSPIFPGLPSGTYTVTVRDATLCSVTGTATISDIGAPVIDAINIVEPDCGQVNGTITIEATGTGTLNYSINGTTYVTSNVFGPLAPGNYIVYVRDANGCITSQHVTVNTTDGPQIDNIIVVDTECGKENGSITIIASGGTGELKYEINGDGFDYENVFEDLEPGTYDIIVRDESGCDATAQVEIEVSEGPDLDVIVEPAHCGLATGCVIFDASGGIPPYTYSFNGGSFSPVAEYCNLLSEFYVIIVRDAVGCTTETEIFVFEEDGPPAPLVTTTDPGCGLNDGTIEIENADDNLQYSLFHPALYQDSPIFYPVAPGTYTVTAKDEWGCTSTAVAVINANPAPVITNVIVVNSTCGTSTGSLEIIVTGGTTPYTYSLDGVTFVSSNKFTGLPAGSYTVIVKGANGCEDSEVRVITSIGAQLASVSADLCPGDTLIVAGDTFSTTGVYTINLIGGASNGCDSIITLTISPLDLEALTITETICAGEVYTINGVDYSVPGVYLIDTINGTIGCDTIRTLDLSVDPLETTYLDVTICNQGVYTIDGVDYTVAGTYTIDTVNAAIGCDSIRILRLVVEDYNESTIIAEICAGDVYTINGVDYTTTGTFLIDTVSGPNGCDTIRTLDLTVNPIPLANAGIDQILNCASTSATLNGSASGGTPLWTGPGINAGNENLLSPEVTVPGTYILTVSSGSSCIDSDSVIVTLDPQTVIADAGLDDSLSCDIDTVVLQANPIGPNYIYQWSGPGINGSNEHLVNPIVTVQGVYTLIVTDTVTDCVSAPDQVVITDITTEIIAIIQNPNSLDCFSTFVDLNATGSSSGPNIIYIWLNEQGEVVGNSPLVEVFSAGEFVFIVKDTLSGCFNDDTVVVADLSLYPPVDAGPPQEIDCNNQIVTLNEGATNNLPNLIFDWEGPAGGILTPDDLLSVEVGSPGFYYLYAMDTVSMCTNYDSVLVSSATEPPLADIDVLEIFTCLDETAMLDIGLSDTGSDITYEWNGPQINGVSATMIEPIQPGVYILTVASSTTGCVAFDTVLLELPKLPTDVDVDIEIPLCQGDVSGTLTINSVVGGIPVYTYSLNGDTAQFIPFFEGLEAGNYVLTVVDANGCEYQESFTMPDGVLLTIDIGPNIDIVLGDSIQLNANVSLPWNLIDSIVWASGDHLSCTHCIDPTLYGLLDEIITATVYAGGCVAEDQISVRVDVDADVYIPNVFSPNGDDINEWVTVFASDNVKKVVYLEIFDRWGNMVFRNTDFLPNIESLGWDGTFKNKPMNPAVFAFIAKVELINGQHLPFKGDITLLR